MSRACLVLLALLQFAPGAAQEPAGTGAIHGRVTDKDTGQPLPNITVRLHAKDSGEFWATRTDDTGHYRLVAIPAGEYSGMVNVDSARSTHASGFFPVGGKPLVLKDGETREVNVALTRTYAIEVRVVDEWGDPLSGLSVTALAPDSGRWAAPQWTHTTDDLGRQRLFGLAPGRYIVCADSGMAGQAPGGYRDALLRTCHPSALDEAEAQVVRVDRSDVGEIEIRMRRGRTVTITGRVTDASGAPAPRAHLMLGQHRSGSSSGISHQADEEGRFRILNVHPGQYALEAWIGGPDQPEQRRPLERAFVPIRVDTTDVMDVSVVMQKTIDVTGRVTLEDATAPFGQATGYGPMAVMSRLADDTVTGLGSLLHAPLDEERTFTMKGVFGRRVLEVVNLPRGWYVRSIRYDGRDIIDEPTMFKDSGGEAAVDVLLSTRGAVVTGRATDDVGNAVAGARIVMFRAQTAVRAWPWPAETRASAGGQFKVGPLRAGDYRIVALPASARPIQPGDSTRLGRLAAAAERITLSELEEKTVDLRIVAER